LTPHRDRAGEAPFPSNLDGQKGQVAIPRSSTSSRNLRGQVAIERPSVSARHLSGQVATEFMIYTAIFMFVAVAAFIVVNDMQRTEVPLSQNRLAKETGQGFVSMITLSMKGGTNFSYNYTYPKTIFGSPYSIYLTNLSQGFMVLEWNGSYGPFSYQYAVPIYKYNVEGACIGDTKVLRSDGCPNSLLLMNDGENLTLMN
jgi:hypothetical protein